MKVGFLGHAIPTDSWGNWNFITRRDTVKNKFSLGNLALLSLFLVLAPAAVASTTWYVNGMNGSDKNDCKTPQTACKTIGHAISLASTGDSIMVAPATYTEWNLTINFNLKIVGSGATTTIIDGARNGSPRHSD